MNQAIQYVSVRKKQAIAILGLSFAAGYLWRWYHAKSRAYVIPGSRSTIPDEMGHYDMDGVSFDDNHGVVVSSDDRTPHPGNAKVAKKLGTLMRRDQKPHTMS
jgi:hypothetical protein